MRYYTLALLLLLSACNGTATESVGVVVNPPPPVVTPPPPPPVDNNATLEWVAPTLNTNGSALTDLSGYDIRYGTSPTELTNTIHIGIGLSMYVISNLAAGTWYFAMDADASDGKVSVLSNIVSKVIP